jgi:hypothetical protein
LDLHFFPWDDCLRFQMNYSSFIRHGLLLGWGDSNLTKEKEKYEKFVSLHNRTVVLSFRDIREEMNRENVCVEKLYPSSELPQVIWEVSEWDVQLYKGTGKVLLLNPPQSRMVKKFLEAYDQAMEVAMADQTISLARIKEECFLYHWDALHPGFMGTRYRDQLSIKVLHSEDKWPLSLFCPPSL